MFMKDLISIIVPIYKVEKYLEKCLNSIINQTYKNIEIILIDDGSPDNCGKICDEYAKKDSRIKVIHQENKGISAARNIGIDKSIGKYLMFVDSDDYIEETMAEHLYTNLKEYNADLSVCSLYCIINNKVTRKTKKDEIKILSNYNAIKNSYTIDTISNVPWNKLYKKELFNNIKFPEGRIAEDLATMYLILDKCNSVVFSTKPLYYYIRRADSITGKNSEKFHKDKLQGHIEKYYFIKNKYPKMIENYKYTIINILSNSKESSKELYTGSRALILDVLKTKPSIIFNLPIYQTIKLIIFLVSIRLYQFMYYLLKKLSNL